VPRRVSCIPSEDDEFRNAAVGALHGIDGQAHDDDIATLLAAFLRFAYPAVSVHRQNGLARIPGDDVWYAYRDGKPNSRRSSS
jgi:hypothetical protein